MTLDELIRELEFIRDSNNGKMTVRFEPDQGYFSAPFVGTGHLGGPFGDRYVYIKPRNN
jgi:hypothetical protein